MSDVNPGPGWREVRTPPFEGEADYLTLTTADDTEDRYWVREEPVPPLPTAPYTVIRVTWVDRDKGELLKCNDGWVDTDGVLWADVKLPDLIAGFEVLSEPRAVTAKAVLDRVRQLKPTDRWQSALDAVAREFVVES